MELKSEPVYHEEIVNDIDYHFPNQTLSLTLRPGDLVHDFGHYYEVKTVNPPEIAIVYKANLLWACERKRRILIPIKGSPVQAPATPQADTPEGGVSPSEGKSQ